MLRFHSALIAGIVYRVASRWGPPQQDDVNDAIQEVCLKLSQHARVKKIPEAGDQAVEAYLRALAANTASDYFRARNAQRRSAGRTTSLEDPAIQQRLQDPFGPKEIEFKVLLGQIERLFADSPRELTVFRLFYIQKVTAKEIASIPSMQLTVKGVESLIRRMKEEARDKLQGGGEGISARGPS